MPLVDSYRRAIGRACMYLHDWSILRHPVGHAAVFLRVIQHLLIRGAAEMVAVILRLQFYVLPGYGRNGRRLPENTFVLDSFHSKVGEGWSGGR
jgi:hypothetical protein